MNILIAAASDEYLVSVKSIFKNTDFQITVHNSGIEAFNSLKSNSFDLIISDIFLPEMDGFRLCLQCKNDAKLFDIPFIFYSDVFFTGIDEFIKNIGGDLYLKRSQTDDNLFSITHDLVNTKPKNKNSQQSFQNPDYLKILEKYNEKLIGLLKERSLDQHQTISKKENKNNDLFSMLGQIPAGLFITNQNGLIITCNSFIPDQLKLSPDKIINTRLSEFLQRFTEQNINLYTPFEQLQKKLPEFFKTGKFPLAGLSFPVKFQTPEPELKRFMLSFFPIKTDSGYYLGAMLFELTDYFSTNEPDNIEQQLLHNLIETTPDSIYFKDSESRFIKISNTLAKRFGLNNPDEAKGKTDFNFFDPEHAQVAYEDEKRIIETGEPIIGITEKEVWPDGHITWVSTSKIPLFNKEGKITGIMGISRDITDRKQIEDELRLAKEKAEESSRLKTAFIKNVSHEIRTPLNGIIGFSEIITNTDIPPDRRGQFHEIIRSSCDQLMAIIDDIVIMATIESGQEKVEENEVHVNNFLQSIYNQFSKRVQIKNLTFQVTSSVSDDLMVLTDKTKLLQIFSNLLANAVKFTNQGSIKMGCSLEGKSLLFYVEDTGTGIDPKYHENVFDRFFQADASETRVYGGTGLGLSIVKSYIELLNGTINLESSPGKGTKFNFTIPYHPAHFKEMVPEPLLEEETTDFKDILVLIAEDDELNFQYFAEVLDSLGFKILRANNGKEAVETFKNNPDVRLVLMDMRMPVMDGYEASRLIISYKPDAKIIAQTAFVSNEDRQRAIECGCIDFISKPIYHDQLIAKLKKHLSNL